MSPEDFTLIDTGTFEIRASRMLISSGLGRPMAVLTTPFPGIIV